MNSVFFHAAVALTLYAAGTSARAGPALASQLAPEERQQAASAAAERNGGRPLALTLVDAIYIGLQGNRAIRSAYIERVAQKFDLRVAEDRFTPKIVLAGSYVTSNLDGKRTRSTDLTPVATAISPIGTRFSLSWTRQLSRSDAPLASVNTSFSVIQPLLRDAGWDVNMAPVHLARLNEQIYRLDLKLKASGTITQIITAYRELMRAQEQTAIADAALTRSRQLLDINHALINTGRMAEFDIVQTQAEVATQELNAEEAENQLEASRLNLLRLLSMDLRTAVHADAVPQPQPVAINADQALKIALEHQPEYLMQLIASMQTEIKRKVAANQRLWDISLVAGKRHASDTFTATGGHTDAYVGLQFQIPIGDLSRKQNDVRAQMDVKLQALQMTDRRQQLDQDVSNAVREIGTRWRQYGLAQKVRDLSLKKLEIERQKLTLGRSSNFQVLSFEADLRNAENARLNALLAYLNAQSRLDLQLGTTLESWGIGLDE